MWNISNKTLTSFSFVPQSVFGFDKTVTASVMNQTADHCKQCVLCLTTKHPIIPSTNWIQVFSLCVSKLQQFELTVVYVLVSSCVLDE